MADKSVKLNEQEVNYLINVLYNDIERLEDIEHNRPWKVKKIKMVEDLRNKILARYNK